MTTDLEAVIRRITLEEKTALCTGASAWTTTPVEHRGIPEMIVSDGPHGVRRVPDVHSMGQKSLPATCFPTASCLASTWDVELVKQMGVALAEECIAVRCHIPVTLKSTFNLPCVLDKESTIREWLDDSRGKVIFSSYYSRIETEARKMFGSGGEDRYASEGAMGMDIMDLFNDMPLVSVLMFEQSAWDKHPEDIVGELLQQVHSME